MGRDLRTPYYLRTAFHEALAAWRGWQSGTPEPMVSVKGEMVPIARVAGLLWNSGATLPADWCLEELQLRSGSTYAQAARRLKAALG